MCKLTDDIQAAKDKYECRLFIYGVVLLQLNAKFLRYTKMATLCFDEVYPAARQTCLLPRKNPYNVQITKANFYIFTVN